METLSAGIGLVTIVVFFVMSSNLGQLKRLAEEHSNQNREIIRLLRLNTPQDKLAQNESGPITNDQSKVETQKTEWKPKRGWGSAGAR